jgi:dATP pyrophosphohydrolase
MIETHIFRKGECGIEYLMLKRSKTEVYPGLWQMITGAVDQGEKALAAALREINEETGLVPKKFYTVPYVNSFFNPKRNHICMVPVFLAQADEMSQVKISHEHSEYKWVRFEEGIKMLSWQGQRIAMQTINEFLTDKNCVLKFEEIKL